MGYNTVAFLLNDLMSTLRKSPNAVVWALTHPPLGKMHMDSWRKQVNSVADSHKEPRLHEQALELLPTFHADDSKFLYAGRNTIVELKYLGSGKTTQGKKTVTLELPEWW